MALHHVSTSCYLICMDEEKEFEQVNNLSYDEMVVEGLIIPGRNSQRAFTIPKGKI